MCLTGHLEEDTQFFWLHWKMKAMDLKERYRNLTRAKKRKRIALSQSDVSSVHSEDFSYGFTTSSVVKGDTP